ncbi:E3 ubiquitin-protein ligase TRIM39 [Polyodon spathula]|uniref:E3 ubiquitin-protein ligase TRIM39 n=1 Tax=Polyodon spathula TaxID=7913 RepID=UPI001B7EC0E4|nr:E3 ubiquitin-protein ligase TRIM39 [Polyodon spathula]XP_041094199.1 E3 ubiquitin-protein ligase TRIM39 [Polyodon spathula]XP_041094200.1 E3 ubiquitin-protein ligase TRIM39 [Polyodon spathula]XP_041094201.1 E3 ubiquitin-protein ligase TRIM39 [Polyodon spathula]XP_041094202.1 E3 ubiquitin-protein ligase TRIM39 [Polyodon spathula]XP_041094203.1 E3 ubiquitin-protein ligase TRIM39 [Polyodon spathula]
MAKKKAPDLLSDNHTVDVIRWKVCEEKLQLTSSVPFNKPNLSTCPQQTRWGLKDFYSLEECVSFITQWSKEVERLSKRKPNKEDGGRGEEEEEEEGKERDRGAKETPGDNDNSLEACRRCILGWAKELNTVAEHRKTVKKGSRGEQQQEESERKEEGGEEEEKFQRIMNWARELQTVSEGCGLAEEGVAQSLAELGLDNKRLGPVLPLLEFITWSLLQEHTQGGVPELWLSTKQNSRRADAVRYIPDSVWKWICSAAADVTLDPDTAHPWLILSKNGKSVRRGETSQDLPEKKQRFDWKSCVQGWQGFTSGRHYWEVEVEQNSAWRVGVTAASAQRKGRFSMHPAGGYWTIWRSQSHLWACTDPKTCLPLSLDPRKVGVFVDYEEGKVSFYNADKRSHIYTFSDTFTEKLYPVFAIQDEETALVITSPSPVSTRRN